jgi:hypothetical protein
VDDAFAGGVCRCPYCKAMVMVPGRAEAAASARPEAPPVRPAAPPAADERAAEPAAARHVPMARRVLLTPAAGVLVAALVLGLIGGGIYLAVRLAGAGRQEPKRPGNGPPRPAGRRNPYALRTTPDGDPTIAGLALRPPLVYCIDNSAALRPVYDPVCGLVLASVAAMSAEDRFTVLLCSHKDDEQNPRQWAMPGGYVGGGRAGRAAAKAFLRPVTWFDGSELIATLQRAMLMRPGTIVLCSAAEVPTAGRLGQQARQIGAAVVTIAVTADAEAAASMAELAEASGGRSWAVTPAELDRLYEAAERAK